VKVHSTSVVLLTPPNVVLGRRRGELMIDSSSNMAVLLNGLLLRALIIIRLEVLVSQVSSNILP